MNVATTKRYVKPCMTDLPKEIFEEIIHAPRMDYKKMKEEADLLEQNMMEEMEKHGKEIIMCYTVNEIKEKVTPVAKSFGVKSVSLFGSYARGNADAGSDVDIYIEKGKIKNLIQYFMFVNELEKILECHVDVVTTGIEDQNFLMSIQKEGVLLYEE